MLDLQRCKLNGQCFLAVITTLSIYLGNSSQARASDGTYFVRPVVGLSQVSDTSGDSMAIGTVDGNADVDLSQGFNAGLGFGYQYANNIEVEVFWEYRTNDSEVLLADDTQFTEGNYASNIFYLNGRYYFGEKQSAWRTFIGAGIGWIQEIDIDLETAQQELSYSGSGDIGFQAIIGARYKLSDAIHISAELRAGRFSSIDLDAESPSSGQFDRLDYDPITVQVGLSWYF